MTGGTLPAQLQQQITDCGYYPELVSESVQWAVGEEPVQAFLVHHEATFNSDEVQRHLSVLVLTPSRLVVGHTDESHDNPHRVSTAITSTESIPLPQIRAVSLTRVVADAARHGGGNDAVVETWLTLGWGTLRRMDLEPARCADPDCEADHGYSGSSVLDDITVRMSPAADGPDAVARLVGFATALQRACGTAR